MATWNVTRDSSLGFVSTQHLVFIGLKRDSFMTAILGQLTTCEIIQCRGKPIMSRTDKTSVQAITRMVDSADY